jgi:hypothetical protein
MPIPTRFISSGFKTKPPNGFIPAFYFLFGCSAVVGVSGRTYYSMSDSEGEYECESGRGEVYAYTPFCNMHTEKRDMKRLLAETFLPALEASVPGSRAHATMAVPATASVSSCMCRLVLFGSSAGQWRRKKACTISVESHVAVCMPAASKEAT